MSDLDRLSETLEVALSRLESARPFAKARYQTGVLDVSYRLMAQEGGLERLHALAPRLDQAGIFRGSDWDQPETLQPQFVASALDAPQRTTVALEALSLLRMLALAGGEHYHPGIHAEHARHFLTQVLALNINRFFGQVDEAGREAEGARRTVERLLRYLAERIGFKDVLGALVNEIWRILAQRPVNVGPVKEMITQIAVTLSREGGEAGEARIGADRLVSALFGTTSGCLDDPGIAAYRDRLSGLQESALLHEAHGFARAMHDTGLVSDYHAGFLVWALDAGQESLIPEALGLDRTGLTCYRRHEALVHDLIRAAVGPETPQAVYGLSLLLQRGILHHPPIAPSLRRQVELEPSAQAAARIASAYGPSVEPKRFLTAGVLQVLGQPLGVGQGANPTCQSARAMTLWSLNDPDYLLDLVARAARFDRIEMYFEGQRLNSAALPTGLTPFAPLDSDPVSVVLVPHLDRIYAEMGRRCADRPEEDPHVWVNPEFHGWWVARHCCVAVDVASGALLAIEDFLASFHSAYHPSYNGGEPLIHPQPAGVAVTDPGGEFIGWHAIAILRVAPDQDGVMRVYFYNPNNDSGQDWGGGVKVSTQGQGENYGEASLPFDQFAARLYLFHEAPAKPRGAKRPPAEELSAIAEQIRKTWAAYRGELQVSPIAAQAE